MSVGAAAFSEPRRQARVCFPKRWVKYAIPRLEHDRIGRAIYELPVKRWGRVFHVPCRCQTLRWGGFRRVIVAVKLRGVVRLGLSSCSRRPDGGPWNT